MTAEAWDVIVIGGGPAGTAAAAILAEAGKKVLVLEKRSSESEARAGSVMAPVVATSLRRLGLLDAAKNLGCTQQARLHLLKRNGSLDLALDWSSLSDPELAWNAPRGAVEALILQRALAMGAVLRRGVEVLNLIWNPDGDVIGVRAQDETGEEQLMGASMILDASGSEALSAHEKGWRMRDLWLDQMAIWNEFELGKPGLAEPPGTSVIAYANGKHWFWFQRLEGSRASIGLVGERTQLFSDAQHWPQTFHNELANCPWLRKRLRDAKPLAPFRAHAGFSGRSLFCGTDGLLMLGDAFGFIDPFLFSGFALALESGIAAAEATIIHLEQPELAREASAAYGEQMRKRLEPLWRLCFAFYRDGFALGKFLSHNQSAKKAVEAILAGDLNESGSILEQFLAKELPLPPPLHFTRPINAFQVARKFAISRYEQAKKARELKKI